MEQTALERRDALVREQPPALRSRRVHEVSGAARAAFAVVQAAHLQGPLIWIQPEAGAERPDPHGLARFIDPARLVLALTPREEDVFWAMEEALRSGAAPLVVAETASRGPHAVADLTRSRRLQLAAEAGGGLGLMLTGEAAARNSNAAETRWLAEPDRGLEASGAEALEPVWEWRLLKNKRGGLGAWRVRWLAAAPTGSSGWSRALWRPGPGRPESGDEGEGSSRRFEICESQAHGDGVSDRGEGSEPSPVAGSGLRDRFGGVGVGGGEAGEIEAGETGAKDNGNIEVGHVGECWEPWRAGGEPSHLVAVAAEGRGREHVAA